jgi:hypothetical protein
VGNSGRAGRTGLRQAVHGLRGWLEPERRKHAPWRFVLARANAYELDTGNNVVDADEFEQEAVAVLRTLERSIDDKVEAQLARVAGIYGSEFLADEPYVEWALAERDRLRASLHACCVRSPRPILPGDGVPPRPARCTAPRTWSRSNSTPSATSSRCCSGSGGTPTRHGGTSWLGDIQACVRARAGLHAGRSGQAGRRRGVAARGRTPRPRCPGRATWAAASSGRVRNAST